MSLSDEGLEAGDLPFARENIRSGAAAVRKVSFHYDPREEDVVKTAGVEGLPLNPAEVYPSKRPRVDALCRQIGRRRGRPKVMPL